MTKLIGVISDAMLFIVYSEQTGAFALPSIPLSTNGDVPAALNTHVKMRPTK